MFSNECSVCAYFHRDKGGGSNGTNYRGRGSMHSKYRAELDDNVPTGGSRAETRSASPTEDSRDLFCGRPP
jgi:hypothetical protein